MKKRILAVDDNPMMRQVYERVVSDAGYDVTVVRDGIEALRTLEAETPDLILLDIDMPNLSGWEVLEIVRKDRRWEETPIIMVSALPEPVHGGRAASLEYNCYVTKKKTGKDLLILVEQALRGSLASVGRDKLDNSIDFEPEGVATDREGSVSGGGAHQRS